MQGLATTNRRGVLVLTPMWQGKSIEVVRVAQHEQHDAGMKDTSDVTWFEMLCTVGYVIKHEYPWLH